MRFANFDDALDWYVKSNFTAEDATRASGVSEAVQRLMQKQKIFSPVPQTERTAKRMLFGDTVMRLSIANEFNRCGIPLIPASKIIYADTLMDPFQLSTVDPFQMFFDGYDKEKQRYIRREGNADPDGLYDPTKPVTLHKTDHFFEIINSRYVVPKPFADEEGHVLGELTPDRSDFIVWEGRTFDHIIAGEKLRPTLIDDAGLRAIIHKKPTKADEEAAEFARANPTSKISVNVGMALRAALRRLLYIDPANPEGSI